MYNCPKCHTPFEAGTKFCPNCGCNLEEEFIIDPICPVCRKTYPTGTVYCSEDGAKLVPPDKMVPRCVICGTVYDADTKFCPKDGGAVIPEALRHTAGSAPAQQPGVLRKGSLGNRFVAYLLDSILTTGLSIPALIVYYMGIAHVDDLTSGYEAITFANLYIYIILGLLLYLIPLVYVFIKDGLRNGQSLGKRAMGLKVVNVDDRTDCTKATSALRALITILIVIVPIVGWIIEPIMVLATSDGRRLADKAAGTMVVNA